MNPLTRRRTGLVLAAVLCLVNVLAVLQPTPEGEAGAPWVVLVVGAILGVVGLVAVVIAWRRGSRVALRVASGVIAFAALTAMPAFFVDVAPALKAAVAGAILLTVLAVVLMLSTVERTVGALPQGAVR